MPEIVLTEELIKRFEAKIERIPECGCWIWMGSCHYKGYGLFRTGNKISKAHRVSWFIHYGPIPTGECVLHHCDTPACVNPHHLFVGTHKDNAYDRDTKKRGYIARGEQHYKAKLTDRAVLKIRNSNYSCRMLAKKYKVDPTMISLIKRRKNWKHL